MSHESFSSLESSTDGGSHRILLEPYLQSAVVGDVAELSWKEGPRANENYDSVRLADCDFSATPRIEKMEEQILDRFREHRAENISADTYEADEADRVRRAIGEAITILYEGYYGTTAYDGIELAQMFDLNGEGERYNKFANNIITGGRRAYLAQLGLQHGIKGLDISYGASMTGVGEAAELCFIGDGDPDEYASMALTHSTVSDITPAIIQMRAIVSDAARKRAGLTKMSGESKKAWGFEREDVFFWPNETITHTYPFERAFYPEAGLELPAVWGIKDTTPLKDVGLQIQDGSWANEKMIASGVPLEFFTNLWVPPMAVARHSALLQAHGYGHIQVSSFPSLGSQSYGMR